jgi:hypothetical protein
MSLFKDSPWPHSTRRTINIYKSSALQRSHISGGSMKSAAKLCAFDFQIASTMRAQ